MENKINEFLQQINNKDDFEIHMSIKQYEDCLIKQGVEIENIQKTFDKSIKDGTIKLCGNKEDGYHLIIKNKE